MAKRFQLSEFGRTTKKPKLDISINKGPSTPILESPGFSAATSSYGGFGNVPSFNDNNFWDDDDDDVILLATQVAESQVAAAVKETITRNDNETYDDLTFSEFAPHVLAQTSTQRPLLTDFLDDDDDDCVIVAAAVECQQQTSQAEVALFKKPTVLPSQKCDDAQLPTTSLKLHASHVGPAMEIQSQSQARRQLASERQIKFLMERVDGLKKENTKMAKDIEDNKAKMESKDGEATLLRDELRHMKQQMQTLKMEKIFSSEAAKSECNTKIAELHKQMEAKETALQLKAVECSRLKMRHADDTQRFEMTLRDTSLLNLDCDAVAHTASAARSTRPDRGALRSLMRLRGLQLNHRSEGIIAPTVEPSLTFEESVYANTLECGTSHKQRTLFQLEFAHLQMVVAKWQLLEQQQCTAADETQSLVETIVGSACKVLPEFWSYVHGLTFPKNCRFHPYHEYSLQQEQSNRHSLLQPEALFSGECIVSLRRYVAVLAVLCGQVPSLAQPLLSHHHGEYQLLQIASDALGKLSFAREICDHFGVLEAFATLVHSLLRQLPTGDRKFSHNGTFALGKEDYKCEAGERIVLLTSLWAQLVFARPSAWVLRELSACLLVAAPLHRAMGKLCWNSSVKTFQADRLLSVYRYRSDSCVLQVYAGLLEIAFPPHVPLGAVHMALLAEICENHVRFVYQCFTEPPFFIFQGMPIDHLDLEEEGASGDEQRTPAEVPPPFNGGDAMDESTSLDSSMTISTSVGASANSAFAQIDGSKTEKSGNVERPCTCYRRLCLSVVTLLFQLLRQWLRTGNASSSGPMSQVPAISQMGVQLLHIIFCDNYNSQLFSDSEESTKHHLYLICKWWTENTSRLRFNDIHMKLLRKLQNSHVVPKPLSDEDTPQNVSKDLEEWYSTVASDHRPTTTSISSIQCILDKLQLVESAGCETTFFECLRGYAFNFE